MGEAMKSSGKEKDKKDRDRGWKDKGERRKQKGREKGQIHLDRTFLNIEN